MRSLGCGMTSSGKPGKFPVISPVFLDIVQVFQHFSCILAEVMCVKLVVSLPRWTLFFSVNRELAACLQKYH